MASNGALFIMVLLLLFGTGSNPRGEKIEKDVKVCEKETVTLVCGTDAQKASYRWKFASRKQVPIKTDKYEQLQNGAILLVKNIDHSDVAKIKYISCHTHSEDMRKIIYLYKIVINCENFQTPAGSSVRLPCKTNIPDDELDYIKWTFVFKRHSKTERMKLFRKDGTTTLASSLKFNGRISVQNKTLILQNIKMEDVGAYQCVAYRKKNFHLSNSIYYYNVNVTARTTTEPIAVDTTASTNTITLGPNIGYTVEPAKTVAPNTSSQPQFTTPTTPTRKTVNISTESMQVSTTPTSSSTTLTTPIRKAVNISTESMQMSTTPTASSTTLTTPIRKAVNISTESMQMSTTPTASSTTLTTPIRKAVNISTESMQVSTTSTVSSRIKSTQSSVLQTNTRSTVLTTQTAMPTAASLPNTELNKRFTTKPRDLLPTTSYTANSNETQKQDDRTPNGTTRSAPSKWLLMILLFNLVNSLLNYACA